jgi:hypothetical protein
MGSVTKKQREQEEVVKRMIVDGHRRGVCDGEGRSVKNAAGVVAPPPRTIGVHRTFRYDRTIGRMVEVT